MFKNSIKHNMYNCFTKLMLQEIINLRRISMIKKQSYLLFGLVLLSSLLFTTMAFAEPKASHPSNIVIGNWRYCATGLSCATPNGQVTWVANNAGTIYDSANGPGQFSGSWSNWIFTGTATFPNSTVKNYGYKVIMDFSYNAGQQKNLFLLKIYYIGADGNGYYQQRGYGTKM